MASAPSGWYPDPENPSGQRWWDGTRWTGRTSGGQSSGPQAQVPPPPPAPPLGGWAIPATTYQRSSNAGWALGLAIAGFLCCGPLSIAGMIMGRSEVKAIDQGRADPANRGTANAAFIVGLIATILFGLIVVGYVFLGFALGSTG